MDPLIAVVLLAVGVAIGWVARGRRLKRRDAAYGFQHETPRFKIRADKLTEDELKRFLDKTRVVDDVTGERPEGGWVGPPNQDGDSIPFLMSEGGCLLYPHGDHSGPTAMDQGLRTFTADKEPPFGERIRMMPVAGQYVVWDGKRYYWEHEGDDPQLRDCWPPDPETGPWVEVPTRGDDHG